MSCIVEMKNIAFSAQNRKIVHDVSFRFEEGKVTGIVGPSGIGKTTVIKLAAGLIIPDEGEVLFRGEDIARMNRAENLNFRQEAAVVFQDSALWANQSLFQILELPLRLHFPSMAKSEREGRIKSVVGEVGYKKDLGVRPAQLSMGEQKLIAFARALICGPRLLFLDEWTESLDENASQRLIGMVKKMRDGGVTVILVSHDMRIIHELVDVAVMIQGGSISLRVTRGQFNGEEDFCRYIERGMAS
jgi:ABC-type multidrug transport system ATPase subunit